MTYHLNDRVIKSGTVLVCPKCKSEQALVTFDIYPDKHFDWRDIKPIPLDGIVGISNCCDERYITFSGLFCTAAGPV